MIFRAAVCVAVYLFFRWIADCDAQEIGIGPCDTANCGNNAVCMETGNSYECVCMTGYIGNGTSCEDINECDFVGSCAENAFCTNTPGSFICECVDGYFGDGTQCSRVTSSSVLMSSSVVTEDSVTLTSSIFMTSEVDVTISTSMRTDNESTTSSHLTPSQTVVHSSSEGRTTQTQTVVYSFIITSRTPTPTESNPGFTGDGLSFIFAIVIGAIAGTILLSICSLLCVKGCCRYRKFGTRSRASIHTSTNEAYGKVVGTTTHLRVIPTSTNKAYGKLRVRGGTHSLTSTNETSREGEEVGYELVGVHCREFPPPPPVGELEAMYEVPFAPVSPTHPLPTNPYPNAGNEEDTVYEVIR